MFCICLPIDTLQSGLILKYSSSKDLKTSRVLQSIYMQIIKSHDFCGTWYMYMQVPVSQYFPKGSYLWGDRAINPKDIYS